MVCNLLVLAALCSLPKAWAQEGLGMVTGSKTGTYIKIGRDIADVAAGKGVPILVKESDGSLANIKRMSSRENAAFGIVQSDVLGYLKRSDSEELKYIAGRLRMIFPLYKEEVHIFAGTHIKSLADLNGRRVSVGEPGGGSWMTATNLFKSLGVKPAELLDWDNSKAAAAVIDGNLDAMIYVAGKPVTFFERVGKLAVDPQYAQRFERVHFVPVTEESVLKEYASSSIGRADYPWIRSDVQAIAVRAMLVSYDFSSQRSAYFKSRCEQLGRMSAGLYEALPRLKSGGRTEKWGEVDLDAPFGDWPRDNCVRKTVSAPNDNTESKIKSFLLQ